MLASGFSGNGWRVELQNTWDVLGPFPIHAREQHFLSPSFPLDLTKPIDFGKTWQSSYADDGTVSWTKAHSDPNGTLKVCFQNIRWGTLRATEGWAALQHHAVLRTSFTLHPPQDTYLQSHQPPHLLVELTQGSFFTILPPSEFRSQLTVPEWYPGNIYSMEHATPVTVSLPMPPSKDAPTTYEIVVSGDYEIRLFGDPQAGGGEAPVLSINLVINLESPTPTVVHEPAEDVICDFVDGFAFGDAIGVSFRSVSGWWMVKHIQVLNIAAKEFTLSILRNISIAPTQTCTVPIKITQSGPFFQDGIRLALTWISETASNTITVVLPVKHRSRWSEHVFCPLEASYCYAESTPTPFLVIPPIKPNIDEPHPPIMVLHGAGVDVIEQTFFVDSIPRQKHSWLIFPTGRTSWGLDWHGPSVQDVWGSLDSLSAVLDGNELWRPWKLRDNTPILVMGHSNGGQGSWYLGSRYPDKVLAVVAAAGYIKPQAYVPLTQSRSAHFIDPALSAILESALTPDENDLFLSNLVDTPVLAVHGGADNNVPTWHSREAVGILKAWNPNANVMLREDVHKPHWYPSALNNPQIQTFLDSISKLPHWTRTQSESFTLTVAVPSESGTLHGWRIESLCTPGRLARLHVQQKNGHVQIKTTNVNRFSTRGVTVINLVVDGSTVPLSTIVNTTDTILLQADASGSWRVSTPNLAIRLSGGRIQAILSSPAPFLIVVPNTSPGRELSAALRIAHALSLYHKLEAEILESSQAVKRMEDEGLPSGNIVIVGDVGMPFVQQVLEQKETPFELIDNSLALRGRSLVDPGLGILFTHPHPNSATSQMLFLLGTDAAGLEKAARLFPIRTSVTVPDWLIIGASADQIGAAGVIGAGVWGNNWTWNQQMSWLY